MGWFANLVHNVLLRGCARARRITTLHLLEVGAWTH